MKRILLFLHWINLDTAIGAVITSYFIANCLNSSIPPIAAATLLIAVLGIYNFDHLMDARKVSAAANTARHRFYQNNLKSLSIYQLLLITSLITIIWYLPSGILRAGLVLALITGIYFILLFFIFPSRFMLKEVMIGVVYSLALFLAPVYINQSSALDLNNLLLYGQILILAVSNTLIFAWYDHDVDITDGHVSLANNLGKVTVYRIVLLLIALLFIFLLVQVISFDNYTPQLIIGLMGGTLLYSLLANRSLSVKDRYRVIGDAVFIIPIISLWL